MSRKINKYYYVVITGGIFGLTYLCQNLQPAQIACFNRISKTKTPSPTPETGLMIHP